MGVCKQINSNTWGDKFATNVINDKPNAMPPETIQGSDLEQLRNVMGLRVCTYIHFILKVLFICRVR